MADSSSHSLLATYGDNGKAKTARKGKQSAIKTPLYILFLTAILIGCIIATVAILTTSHEDQVKSWRVQPSVLLSFLSGIYVMALSGLFIAGVAVTWWRSMMHGTTLKRLHFICASVNPGDSIAAFLAGGHARKVAIVAVIIFVVKIAVGPLTQRATRAQNREVAKSIDMNIRMAKEIPDGYFGNWTVLYYPGIQMAQDTISGRNITNFSNESCPGNGTCSALIYGAGLSHTCTSETRTMNLRDKNNNKSTVFGIKFDVNHEFAQPMIEIEMEYISSVDESCTATVTTDSCFMIPATIWYPVTIDNRTLVLNMTEVVTNLTIVNNYTSAADVKPPEGTDLVTTPIGPLGGAVMALNYYLSAKAILTVTDNIRFSPSDESYLAPVWSLLYTKSLKEDLGPLECPFSFFSPKAKTLETFYSFMFNSAHHSGKLEEVPLQDFTASFDGTELQYITDFGWLAGAIVVMVVGALAAMSLLWGWWQLKRHVTLSPLETGKAFGAPIFLGAGPEQEANAIIHEIGHERVAHDGDELVWNGTVYTTGTSATLVGAKGGLREMDGLLSPDNGQNLSRRGHRRGMSSVTEMGSGSNTPSFEHSFGHTTRVWHEDEERGMGVANYNMPRKRSGSGSSERDSLVPMPLILTPGREGVPELPPIPPSGAIRMDAFGPSTPLPMAGVGNVNALASHPPNEATSMGALVPIGSKTRSRAGSGSVVANHPNEMAATGALVPVGMKSRPRANSGSAMMSPVEMETISLEPLRPPSPPRNPLRARAGSGSVMASPPPNEIISMGAFGPSNPQTRIRSRSGSGEGLPSPAPIISAGGRRGSGTDTGLLSPVPAAGTRSRSGSGSGIGLSSPGPVAGTGARRRSGSGSGQNNPVPGNGKSTNGNTGLKRNLSLIEEISNRTPQ